MEDGMGGAENMLKLDVRGIRLYHLIYIDAGKSTRNRNRLIWIAFIL
jgi:hypothetical protein